MQSIIEIRGLIKKYAANYALQGIDLEVFAGEIFALLGPNGAGKTTLFSILSTLLKPTSGEVKIAGHDVLIDRALIRSKIGIVFQIPALDRVLSVSDNLYLMAKLYGFSKSLVRQRIDDVVNLLNLKEVMYQPVGSLSGGISRRVELARALIAK